MSGPKRNPDKLNTIGVVVVGICGAVMVYVSIVALQAFYMNDTSELQSSKDYGGMDRAAQGHKADELRNITEAATNPGAPTFRVPIDHAIKLVIEDAKKNPSHLVPSLPPSTKATVEPMFGRPKPIGGAPSPEGGASANGGAQPASGQQPGANAPTEGTGGAPQGAAQQGAGPQQGSAAQGQGQGSAAAANPAGAAGTSAPQTPTGSGPGGGAASPRKNAARGTGTGSATQPK